VGFLILILFYVAKTISKVIFPLNRDSSSSLRIFSLLLEWLLAFIDLLRALLALL
jgi:hypothetical protein